MIRIYILISFLCLTACSESAIERLNGTTWVVNEYFADGDYLYQEYSFEKINDSTYKELTFNKSKPNDNLKLLSTHLLIATSDGIRCETKDTSLNLRCSTDKNDIFFDYDYVLHGENVKMRDAWIYKDDSTFVYKIGKRKDGEFVGLFMQTDLKRK